MSFSISSPSFQNGKDIPKKFTCDGEDVSPALSWANPPSGSKSFALIAAALFILLSGDARAATATSTFTVTGNVVAWRMAATQRATKAGCAIRQAPKWPCWTRSLGQPTLRFTSS